MWCGHMLLSYFAGKKEETRSYESTRVGLKQIRDDVYNDILCVNKSYKIPCTYGDI